MDEVFCFVEEDGRDFGKSHKIRRNVMLNPESVIRNLVQNLFGAGSFQHQNQANPETSSG